MNELKQHLHELCMSYIAERETEIKNAIADAQEAAANETKSSAGDKYETSREMMTQEINMNQGRLAELYKMKAELSLVPANGNSAQVQIGSLVHTTNGNYFISVSIGKLHLEGKTFYAISTSSPIGKKLMNLKAGDSFEQGGRRITVENIE